MPAPIVAIVGAPNVGKSTLFNRLIGRRQAIVSDRSGVTRDRIASECDLFGTRVALFDTGGVVPGETDDLTRRVRDESLKAVAQADLILFVVDARAGLTATDLEIGSILRAGGKPIIPIANKIDSHSGEGLVADTYRLGLGEVVPLSAEQGRGFDDLIDRICQNLPPISPETRPNEVPIALIGRPNVGKSSLFNRIVRNDRALVSSTPGTTRDPIDTTFRYAGTDYRIIDTAGIRRHARSGEDVERISVVKARQMLKRAEVALTLIDGSEAITHQDQALLGLVLRSRKPTLLAVNKIDRLAALGIDRRARLDEIRDSLRFSHHVPLVPTSALTGEGVDKLLTAMESLRRESRRRFTTSALNAALAALVRQKHPPSDRGRPVRFYYMTQTGGTAPRFVVFSNGRRIDPTYRRYMEGRLRDRLGLKSSPVVLSIRQRPSS